MGLQNSGTSGKRARGLQPARRGPTGSDPIIPLGLDLGISNANHAEATNPITGSTMPHGHGPDPRGPGRARRGPLVMSAGPCIGKD